jgi:hypothetical protein
VAAWRRPEWRPIRFVAAAFPVLLLLVFAMGTQPTYPLGLVAALYAIGCVPTARWWRAGRGRRSLVVGAVVVNSAVAALISLPLVPVDHLGETPIPGINQTARDTVGWPAYVREVGRVYRQLPADEQANLVIIASNYGEAGAIDRYGPDLGLPRVYSPQNQLYFQARPPDRARTVIFVGGEYDFARGLFADCVRVDRLDNAVGVDNEEQGEAVGVCRDPRRDWRVIWARLKHED